MKNMVIDNTNTNQDKIKIKELLPKVIKNQN